MRCKDAWTHMPPLPSRSSCAGSLLFSVRSQNWMSELEKKRNWNLLTCMAIAHNLTLLVTLTAKLSGVPFLVIRCCRSALELLSCWCCRVVVLSCCRVGALAQSPNSYLKDFSASVDVIRDLRWFKRQTFLLLWAMALQCTLLLVLPHVSSKSYFTRA